MTRSEIEGNLERLLILALSIEGACDEADSMVVHQLLDQRARLIDQLQDEDVSEHTDLLQKVAESDRHLIRKLSVEMKMLAGQLCHRTAVGKARELYNPTNKDDGPQLLERLG